MELLNTSKHIHQVSTFNHVIVHCIYFATLFVVYRVEVELEQEAAPSLKTPNPNLVSKASKPPLIMSIKSHFPLMSRLCIFRIITMLRFHRIGEPIPLHDLSFVTVVSKPQS